MQQIHVRPKEIKVLKNLLLFTFLFICATLCTFAQTGSTTAQITGTVKDPNQAVLANVPVVLTNVQTKAQVKAVTNSQGDYSFSALPTGVYTIEADANGFNPSISGPLSVADGETVNFGFALTLAGTSESVTVSAGSVENAYRVDTVKVGTPLGTTPIVNLPYSINVISRQLIDDTMSRNFKEAAKYLPLVSFQETQGPEILRPETRGMQGTNMQNDRKDGMGIAVTTPYALEEFEQIEVVNGLGGAMYGPTNPSGMFNFVSKSPTERPFHEAEVEYEGRSVVTGHLDVGGRLGPQKMFGYRINGVLGDGTGYVADSELRRQLGAIALDVRPFAHTAIEGNFSYYEIYQHGYPGWFSYNPTLTPTAIPTAPIPGTLYTLYTTTEYSKLPVNAPNPTRRGYGQSFLGVDTNNQISEVRLKQDWGQSWHLVAGVLHEIADRNVNSAFNAFYDTTGDYQTFIGNESTALFARYQVNSDLAYVTGKFKTGPISHEVVFGTTGYRFAQWSFLTTFGMKLSSTQLVENEIPLCTTVPTGSSTFYGSSSCHTNISDPVQDLEPAVGVPSYTKTNATNGIYISSILHQQGFSFGDTLTLTPRWLLRVAASQDWTWTNNYLDNPLTGYQRVSTPVYEASLKPPVPYTGNYMHQGVSPSASLIYKPSAEQTAYVTWASSIQAPDVAPATSGNTLISNANEPLPPYRSTEVEAGYKIESNKLSFTTALFRIRRPFADVKEVSVFSAANTTAENTCGVSGVMVAGQICETDEIIGQQINYGAEAMLSGRVTPSLMITGGITALNPKLTQTFVLVPVGNQYASAACVDPTGVAASALVCPTYVTNNKNFVGIPDYKSNILAEYHLPVVTGAFLNFDWQHVGRRAADDMNSYWVPQYNDFDLGGRYTARVFGRMATWRVTVNNITNVHYWSTLGPNSITGASSGAYLGHLGEPRLVTASMRYDF
jgi:iron complex outermembrane receptor protein